MSFTEETVQCPYDKHHIVLKSRLISHLCKCRKAHPGTKFAICPFNATHNVPAPELKYHTEICQDRRTLDSHLYVVGEKNESNQPVCLEVPSSENWDDDESQVQSYLDVKDDKISNQLLLRLPKGKSKAQRKEFFDSETKRFEKLSSGETISNSAENLELTRVSPAISDTGSVQKTENDTNPSTSLTECKDSEFPSAPDQTDANVDEPGNSYEIVLENTGQGEVMTSTCEQEFQ